MFPQNAQYMLSYEAGADLSDKQFYFVKRDAMGRVVLCSVKGERVLGVLQNKPKLGETAQVVLAPGGSPVISAGAHARDALLITDADGKADVKDAANQFVAGFAEKPATAADQTQPMALWTFQASN